MHQLRPSAVRLAVVISLGLLQGCGWGAPKPPTPAQTLKADTQTQDAMRAHYGNMIGDKAKSQSRRPSRSR
ncbi:hypothetical protein [Planctomyces sp. SH-PL62]|uniref:hypothetical protein n=1 Tax=Planctomyces sp. SH-PL62 TaxID=1636152 RepID=UPI00078ECE6A|nr:hypothetical protein [Planctomyces sp. SH-PL62]AMV36156.1 hypothetical protein VT85_01840 [Planctomyces sp. SH-PL62]